MHGYLARSFDLLNVRDLDLISQAKQHCSWLTLGVFDDDFAARLGRRPMMPLAERVALSRHVRGVDEVLVHDEEAPLHDVLVFAVNGEVPPAGARDVLVLSPRRETASALLRNALRQVADGRVA